jgi:hypothetical protein
MSPLAREVRPAPLARHVLNEYGVLESVPNEWSLLPPGDAALSRRIKRDGPTLTVVEMKGRKRFSRGIWAPHARIEALRAELRTEREDPAYQKKVDAGRRRRTVAEEEYALDFRDAVVRFLNVHPRHAHLARTVANLIAEHATPVGSGTVARTQRIPIDARAEAATIAWLRHQTTGYDDMNIPREKGRRRDDRVKGGNSSDVPSAIQSVFRNAISADLSSAARSSPYSCPGTARAFTPGPFQPVGT